MTQPIPITPANDPATETPATGARFFNRELSWLAFNRRVLEEACNPAHPLLERLRFLSISGNNIDEFFMVRVAGLKGQQLAERRGALGGRAQPDPAARRDRRGGGRADRQPAAASGRTCARRCARRASIVLAQSTRSVPRRIEWLERHFDDHISRVLTPQAIDPAHPFPFIPNKGFSLIFDLRRISDGEPIRELLMIPASLPRFVRLPGEAARYVPIETLIRRQIAKLFPGYELLGGGAFRIIRDSDIEIEEEAEDLVRFFRSAHQAPAPGPGDPPEAGGDDSGRYRGPGPRGHRRLRRPGLRIDRLPRHRRSRPAGRRGSARPQIPALHAALSRADPRI